MARRNKRLTDAFVMSTTKPGCYGDGRGGSGLQLRVHLATSGHVTKSWRQAVSINGKPTSLGVGRWPEISLDEARVHVLQNRIAIARGTDPRTKRRAAPAPVVRAATVPAPPATPVPTFGDCALSTIKLNRENWRKGSTTEAYWRRSLLGLPFIGQPVDEVTSADIINAVRPIWTKTPRKAADTLRFIGSVVRWAIAHEHRTDDPTTAVRAALPKQRRQTKHYEALSVADIPEAMRKLNTCTKGRTPLPRLAIRFCWLTASRPGEAATARWEDIDIPAKRWTMPRTKNGKAFSVPLTEAALDVLNEAARFTGKRLGLIFPNRNGKRFDGATLKRSLRMCGIGATVHGTSRSGFRVWAAENKLDRYVSEMVLNHDTGSAVEQAYQRSDLYEQRAEIMEKWAEHISG